MYELPLNGDFEDLQTDVYHAIEQTINGEIHRFLVYTDSVHGQAEDYGDEVWVQQVRTTWTAATSSFPAYPTFEYFDPVMIHSNYDIIDDGYGSYNVDYGTGTVNKIDAINTEDGTPTIAVGFSPVPIDDDGVLSEPGVFVYQPESYDGTTGEATWGDPIIRIKQGASFSYDNFLYRNFAIARNPNVGGQGNSPKGFTLVAPVSAFDYPGSGLDAFLRMDRVGTESTPAAYYVVKNQNPASFWKYMVSKSPSPPPCGTITGVHVLKGALDAERHIEAVYDIDAEEIRVFHTRGEAAGNPFLAMVDGDLGSCPYDYEVVASTTELGGFNPHPQAVSNENGTYVLYASSSSGSTFHCRDVSNLSVKHSFSLNLESGSGRDLLFSSDMALLPDDRLAISGFSSANGHMVWLPDLFGDDLLSGTVRGTIADSLSAFTYDPASNYPFVSYSSEELRAFSMPPSSNIRPSIHINPATGGGQVISVLEGVDTGSLKVVQAFRILGNDDGLGLLEYYNGDDETPVHEIDPCGSCFRYDGGQPDQFLYPVLDNESLLKYRVTTTQTEFSEPTVFRLNVSDYDSLHRTTLSLLHENYFSGDGNENHDMYFRFPSGTTHAIAKTDAFATAPTHSTDIYLERTEIRRDSDLSLSSMDSVLLESWTFPSTGSVYIDNSLTNACSAYDPDNDWLLPAIDPPGGDTCSWAGHFYFASPPCGSAPCVESDIVSNGMGAYTARIGIGRGGRVSMRSPIFDAPSYVAPNYFRALLVTVDAWITPTGSSPDEFGEGPELAVSLSNQTTAGAIDDGWDMFVSEGAFTSNARYPLTGNKFQSKSFILTFPQRGPSAYLDKLQLEISLTDYESGSETDIRWRLDVNKVTVALLN